MRRKIIVLVGPAFPLRGGLAAFNERLAAALQAEGHEVILYTFSLQYPGFLFPGKSQFSEEAAPANLSIKVCINSVNPFNWIKVGNELRKLQPDLVLFRFWIPFMGPCFGTIARIIKKNKKIRILTLLDNVIPHEKRLGDAALTSYFLKKSDAFIAMSKQVVNDLHIFIPQAIYKLIPHPLYDYGIQIERYEACSHLGIDSQKKNLLFFGFIRGYKGLDLLLKAFALALKLESDLHLIIAGEFYENEQPYLDIIREKGIANKITLKNEYIPDSEVKYYFGAADVVVQPYKTATQSGISQMAFHFEKPMIVTNVGGLPEIVPDGIAGYVTAPNEQAVADAIVRFFQENKSAAFTEGVRKEKIKYSWSNFTRGIEELQEQLS